MENRLAMTADNRHALWRDAKFTASGKGGVGKDFSQPKIQLTEISGGDGVLFRHTQNFLAKPIRKFNGGVPEQLGVQIWRRARNAS